MVKFRTINLFIIGCIIFSIPIAIFLLSLVDHLFVCIHGCGSSIHEPQCIISNLLRFFLDRILGSSILLVLFLIVVLFGIIQVRIVRIFI